MSTERYKKVTDNNKKHIIINNFLGGISWGLGVIIGTTIIVSIAVFLLRKADVLPIVGNFATYLANYIEEHKNAPK